AAPLAPLASTRGAESPEPGEAEIRPFLRPGPGIDINLTRSLHQTYTSLTKAGFALRDRPCCALFQLGACHRDPRHDQ
ncbi:hypothetical protein CEE86_14735, partial [Lactobacillus crispatus]